MENVELSSWADFEVHLGKLYFEHAERKRLSGSYVSSLLFRGQANACWQLATTLERYTNSEFTFSDYFRTLRASLPYVETMTNSRWNLPSQDEFEAWTQRGFPGGTIPAYDYLVYMRHHAFPSPLLDWTASPYVAAFFAFRNANDSGKNRVSIYAFQEWAEGGKSWSTGDAFITGLGPYVRSHARHFLQQSEYTVCATRNGGELQFASHERAFVRAESGQDMLWKFTIPATERRTVLQHLNRYNIHAFSLFGSEESLMETVASREIMFDGKL
jgi:hypothetical protein